jgi:mRNA-degrading endonuclease toxin of MazEF toxin-antitoxin module
LATKSGDYCPEAGDLVWIDLNPTLGHEQSGHRPAIVLTPRQYNARSGLSTSRTPSAIWVPPSLKIAGMAATFVHCCEAECHGTETQILNANKHRDASDGSTDVEQIPTVGFTPHPL